jgi:hypothetical protein
MTTDNATNRSSYDPISGESWEIILLAISSKFSIPSVLTEKTADEAQDLFLSHHFDSLGDAPPLLVAKVGQGVTAKAELPDCGKVHPTHHAAPPVRSPVRSPAQDTTASGPQLDGRRQSG